MLIDHCFSRSTKQNRSSFCSLKSLRIKSSQRARCAMNERHRQKQKTQNNGRNRWMSKRCGRCCLQMSFGIRNKNNSEIHRLQSVASHWTWSISDVIEATVCERIQFNKITTDTSERSILLTDKAMATNGNRAKQKKQKTKTTRKK